MSTTAQVLANQSNAQHSTGPKSPEGKAASSQNATKHGLSGAFKVLPHENQEEFDKLIRSYVAEFQPRTQEQRFLVTQMAQSQWRLARFQRIEAAVVAKMIAEADPGESGDDVIAGAMLAKTNNAFAALQRYAAAAERSYYRARRELEKLSKLDEEAAEAAIHRRIFAPLPNLAAKQNEPNSAAEPSRRDHS